MGDGVGEKLEHFFLKTEECQVMNVEGTVKHRFRLRIIIDTSENHPPLLKPSVNGKAS